MSADALQRALEALATPLHVVAREILAAESRLDAVARDPQGSVVAVLHALPHADREGLADLMAHLAWLRPRLPDWAKLASPVDLAPEAPLRGLLLAERFDPRTRLAAAALHAPRIELGRWHAPPAGVAGEPWIEILELDPADPPASRRARRKLEQSPDVAGASARRAAPHAGRFRSGLAETEPFPGGR